MELLKFQGSKLPVRSIDVGTSSLGQNYLWSTKTREEKLYGDINVIDLRVPSPILPSAPEDARFERPIEILFEGRRETVVTRVVLIRGEGRSTHAARSIAAPAGFAPSLDSLPRSASKFCNSLKVSRTLSPGVIRCEKKTMSVRWTAKKDKLRFP